MNADEARARMVEEQLIPRGITSARVLEAFRRVPRHRFVPEELRSRAYEDGPLAIGYGQTISQPLMVAVMVEALRLHGHERVLEVGTGSGYEAAMLSQLALEVYSIDRLPELAAAAGRVLDELGCANAHITVGDGTRGWPAHAPYDGIIVAAGARQVPDSLRQQLVDGGRLVIPVGSPKMQTLYLLQRQGQAFLQRRLAECVFVPLIGEYGWPPA